MANSFQESVSLPIKKKLYFMRVPLCDWGIVQLSSTHLVYANRYLYRIIDKAVSDRDGNSDVANSSHIKLHRYRRDMYQPAKPIKLEDLKDPNKDGTGLKKSMKTKSSSVCIERTLLGSTSDVILVNTTEKHALKQNIENLHTIEFYCVFVLAKDLVIGDIVDFCGKWQMVLAIDIIDGLYFISTTDGCRYVGLSGYTRLLRAVNSVS